MRIYLVYFSFLISVNLYSVSTINYDTNQIKKGEYKPWFTGPIIAGSGKTMQAGHYNIEPYFFIPETNGRYDQNWNKRKTLRSVIFNPSFFFVTGLNSFMDFQFVANFQSNFSNKQSDTRISDALVGIGIQLCNDNRYTASPDIRLILKEDLALGHYKHLNPSKLGTDSTGNGFYKSGIALNIQKLFYFNRRLLLARCNVNYKISTPTQTSGYSVFGGGPGVRGKISPVQFFNLDLAFEYTLSQQIVFAIDWLYEYQTSGRFKGRYNPRSEDSIKPSSPLLHRFSLAPALEYNFSAAFGIIAGCWFTVAGKNCRSFTTGVIAFNYVN